MTFSPALGPWTRQSAEGEECVGFLTFNTCSRSMRNAVPPLPTPRNPLGSSWQQEAKGRDSLELQFPGQFILGLFQLLALLDVLLLEVVDLCLHRLQLGKELQQTSRAKAVTRPGSLLPHTSLLCS